MTLDQMRAYSEACNKQLNQKFKSDVYSSLLGSRGSKEDLDKLNN